MPLGANKAAIMGVAGVSTEDVVLLSSQTASGDTTISFTTDLTTTYSIYVFRLYNINISSGNSYIQWQVNASGQTGYNEDIQSTAVRAWHYEDDSVAALHYKTAWDQALGDNIFQYMTNGGSADTDSSESGELWLFNPSSTTYAKHFMSRFSCTGHTHSTTGPASQLQYYAGYINTTSAIDDIQFKGGPSTTFDGAIKLWGLK